MSVDRAAPSSHNPPASLPPTAPPPSPQLGQLDVDCAEMFATPPACSARCYGTLAGIGPSCRQSLLAFESDLNAKQASWGAPQTWLW